MPLTQLIKHEKGNKMISIHRLNEKYNIKEMFEDVFSAILFVWKEIFSD